jgi:hypothetical protein
MDGTPYTNAVFKVGVTFFPDQTAPEQIYKLLTLTELADAIRGLKADAKADLFWLKLARFGDQPSNKNCLRYNDNVLDISGVEGDYDGGSITFAEAVELVRAAKIKAVLYTTASNTDEAPHWRVLAPVSTPLPPGDRAALCDRLNGVIGGGLAPESWTLSQAYYFGTVGFKTVQVEVVDGADFTFIDQRDDIVSIGKPKSDKQQRDAEWQPRGETSSSPSAQQGPIDIVDLARYIDKIANEDVDWTEWNTVLMAIWAASDGSDLGLDLAIEWSAKSFKHDEGAVEERWKHFANSPPARIGAICCAAWPSIGTGWTPPVRQPLE